MNQGRSLTPVIQNAINVYKAMFFHFLKHRRGSVISASLLVWLVMKLDSTFRPPENLRHIPHFGLFGVIRSLIKGERYTDIALHTSLPEINSPGSKGIYIVSAIIILTNLYILIV
jgi:hypothetical protein